MTYGHGPSFHRSSFFRFSFQVEFPLSPKHDPYDALRIGNFRRYFFGDFLSTLGLQMGTTAVGWDIYTRTGSKFSLAMAGLAQFLPVVFCFLLAGHIADRYSRRWVVIIAQMLIATCTLGLAVISWWELDHRWIFLCLMGVGTARSFQRPARAAMLPLLIPDETFSNAVTWHSTGFQLASVLGPAAGGLTIALFDHPAPVYIFDALGAFAFGVAMISVTLRQIPRKSTVVSTRDLLAGFRFVRNHQLILGALSLDLFAVLFGGAVMLLPVFAEDILDVGPRGLGWLRTAPAVGALSMAMVLAHRPPLQRVGWALLWAVAGFGVATIVFGFSQNFLLSLAMLFLTGAFDNISVVIRHTLVQTQTPDELRGRVSAVNSLFIGASNELGGFESGIVAHWFGPVVSVVSGGCGTLLIVALVAWRLPKLRRYRTLPATRDLEQEMESTAT